MEELDNIIIKVVDDWVDEVAEIYRDKLPSASGQLHDSVESFSGEENGSIVGGLTLDEYWYYVENGRLPGRFPAVDSIRSWIYQVNIIPEPIQLPSGRNVIPTLDQLAYLIGRSIAKNGIEGKRYLRESVDMLLPKLEEKLNNELTDTAVKIIKTNLDYVL